jgi:hypothetical protein
MSSEELSKVQIKPPATDAAFDHKGVLHGLQISNLSEDLL